MYFFDWVITMDCDRQHQPAQIGQFLELAGYCDCDLVSGSRYMMDFASNDAPPAFSARARPPRPRSGTTP